MPIPFFSGCSSLFIKTKYFGTNLFQPIISKLPLILYIYIYINHILLKHIKLSVQNYIVHIFNIIVTYNKETYDMNCKHVTSTSLTNIWYNFTSRARFPRILVDFFLKKSWIEYFFKNRVSGPSFRFTQTRGEIGAFNGTSERHLLLDRCVG